MVLRVKFLLASLTFATFLLAGCGGQEDTPVEQWEKEADVEEAAPESLNNPGTSNSQVEICQVEEAIEDRGADGGQRLTDELLEEVRAGEFANMQEALAAQGYDCNGQFG